jgi:hypothetical protein
VLEGRQAGAGAVTGLGEEVSEQGGGTGVASWHSTTSYRWRQFTSYGSIQSMLRVHLAFRRSEEIFQISWCAVDQTETDGLQAWTRLETRSRMYCTVHILYGAMRTDRDMRVHTPYLLKMRIFTRAAT